MITREQVKDLQAGDVVEYRDDRFPGVVTTGPVRSLEAGRGLALGAEVLLRYSLNEHLSEVEAAHGTLTVISRAPSPLYVNHQRTEPVAGDVVRDADDETSDVWMAALDFNGERCWLDPERIVSVGKRMPRPFIQRLRLLVDGETGQVVQ